MAKPIIEKTPFNFLNELNKKELFDEKYLVKYKETDTKGRYLYWDQLKWRIDEGDDPKKAWFATKFNRFNKLKYLNLKDKEAKAFSFCVPDSLNVKLYKITEISSKGLMTNESLKRKYLLSSLITEEAISSSQLEGASTTREVAKELLASKKKPTNEDEEMIINNYLAMKEIKRICKEDFSVDLILNLHKIITRNNTNNGNIPGELRSSNKIVITDGLDGNTLHQPPDFKDLPQRLIKICEFANTNHNGEDGKLFIHPVVKAIILHFLIGYEHPFADGNGRTARALFYWYMLKNDFDYFEYLSISKILKEAPKKYALSYLYSESDDNDLTYFISYQIDTILRAIDELLSYLRDKSKEQEELSNLIKNFSIKNRLNIIQKDILNTAIKEPGTEFNALSISAKYSISANSARTYLNKLVEYKLLKKFKEGKTIVYIAPKNLLNLLK